MTANNKYAVEYTEGAFRDLKKLPRQAQVKIVQLADNLSTEPRPEGLEALTQFKGLFRVRIGNYRVVYAIDDYNKLVIISAIGNRKAIYEQLERRYK